MTAPTQLHATVSPELFEAIRIIAERSYDGPGTIGDISKTDARALLAILSERAR